MVESLAGLLLAGQDLRDRPVGLVVIVRGLGVLDTLLRNDHLGHQGLDDRGILFFFFLFYDLFFLLYDGGIGDVAPHFLGVLSGSVE